MGSIELLYEASSIYQLAIYQEPAAFKKTDHS